MSDASGIESILHAVGDFAWNALVEQFEPPFRIKKRGPALQQTLAEQFRYCLDKGGQAQLSRSDDCEDLDILKAFRRLVKHAADEYVVVALSAAGEVQPFMSIFAAKGSATNVFVPEGAHRQIELRVGQKQKTRVLYVHNHPRGIVHDIFGKAALGPSGLDREFVTREYRRWFDTDGLIESEFYLVEGGRFRKFIIPKAADVWGFVQKASSAK